MVINYLSIKVEYLPERENPQDILQSAAQAIIALNNIEETIAKSIGNNISTKLVLQDFEKGSLVVKVMRFFEEPESQLLGENTDSESNSKFVEESRDLAIKKISEGKKKITSLEINEIINGIDELAKNHGVNKSIQYVSLNPIEIANGLNELTKATKPLEKNEIISIRNEEKEDINEIYHKIPNDISIDLDEIEKSITDEVIENTIDSILTIKKPDFLGESQWSFKKGKEQLLAKITDYEWYEKFKSGQLIITPGDALSVKVHEITHYDKFGRVISLKRDIIKVISIIHKESKR